MLLTSAVVVYVLLTYVFSGCSGTVKALLHEVGLTLLAFAVHPFGWGRPYRAKVPPAKVKRRDDAPVVVLVHGCCSNQSTWLWVRSQLAARGVGPIYTINLTPHFASIEHFAGQLHERIQQIVSEVGDRPIALVGHSMGGLVSAYYAEQLAGDALISKVITMAAPLQGTRLAPLGHGICCQQMTPGSPLIVDLRHLIAKPRRTIYYHLASKGDNIVAPFWAALPYLKSPRQKIFDEHGHLMLLHSTKVIDQLFLWLTEPAPKEETFPGPKGLGPERLIPEA
jgi:pimeloyl-ACP methyl ester carboxylesterase